MAEQNFSHDATNQTLHTGGLPEGRDGWSALPYVEVDEIFGLDAAFKRDPRPEVTAKDVEVGAGKMNLSIGVFVNDSGKLHISDVITHARGRRANSGGVESPYLNQTGYAPFLDGVNRLIYGEESAPLAEGRVSTVQTVGGGNALFIGGMLYKESCDGEQPRLLLSENSWPNHPKIFNRLRYETTTYSDFDKKTRAFNGDKLLELVDSLQAPTLLLLQPSCSNPTGNGASKEWWVQLRDLVSRKNANGTVVTVFFDAAYQGFGESLAADVEPVRLFVKAGIPTMTSWSGSKNFGLYGARVGALSVATSTVTERALVHTNLCEIVRSIQSNCPRDGVELVGDVLSDPMLIAAWNQELLRLRSQLRQRRELVAEAIENRIPGYDTGFIRNGQGFFSHFGLTDQQAASLKESGVYLPMKGRVTFPLFRLVNVDYFARALKKALEGSPDVH